MIGLELSKKLKDAGLRWEPKVGDWWHGDKGMKLLSETKLNKWTEWNKKRKHLVWTHWGIVWLPSLSDLLAEIERRGYGWELVNSCPDKYGPYIDLIRDGSIKHGFSNDRNSLDDCAGYALLWIMEQGQ